MKPIGSTDPMASAAADDATAQKLSSLQLCGARTRQGGECRHLAMANGKCRFHGGLSTGPKTAEGLQRSRTSRLNHGGRSQATRDFRALVRQLRADARKLVEAV